MSLKDTIKGMAAYASDAPALANLVMKAQQETMQLLEENQTLKDQVRKLEEQLKVRDTIAVRGRLCYRRLPNGSESGPFCLFCWEDTEKLYTLHQVHPANFQAAGWHCGKCGKFVKAD